MTKSLLSRYWGRVGGALVLFTATGLLLCSPQTTRATEYTFTMIAERVGATLTTPSLLIAELGPSMNAHGTVAFRATFGGIFGATHDGIFTGSGGPLATIDTCAILLPCAYNLRPTINDEGYVAFVKSFTQFEGAIFTGNGGPLTQVSHRNDSEPFGNNPAINNNGLVAFDQLPGSIWAGDGGPLPLTTPLYNTSDYPVGKD